MTRDNLFMKEMSLEVMLYIINKLGGKAGFHKISKVMYFADQAMLKDSGHTMTGDVYIAMEYGTVPSYAYDMLKKVRYQDETYMGSLAMSGEDKHTVKALRQADADYIKPSAYKYLDASIAKYGDKTFGELKELSHDAAWNSVPLDHPIPTIEVAKAVNAPSYILGFIAETH